MELLWRQGYADTSVPDISAATGLSTSSLYNVYSSKLGLFQAALERYLETVIDGRMIGPRQRGAAGLADVEAFLRRLEATVDRTPARGCLAVNTMAEQRHLPAELAAAPDAYRSRVRTALHAAFSRAARHGEIPVAAIDVRTEAVTAIVIAFNLLVAAQAPAAECHSVLRAARSVAAGSA